MEKLLKKGSYYCIDYPETYGCGKVIARYCDTVVRHQHPSFWVDFIDLENCWTTILIGNQSDLGEKIIPVSNSFNEYLKLFLKNDG